MELAGGRVVCVFMRTFVWQRSMDGAAMYVRSMLLQHVVVFYVFCRRLHCDGGMQRIEGVYGGRAVCMQATARVQLRCFAVFEL